MVGARHLAIGLGIRSAGWCECVLAEWMIGHHPHDCTPVDWSLLPEACRQLVVQHMDTSTRALWRLTHRTARQDVDIATQQLSWCEISVTSSPEDLPSELLSRLPRLHHLNCSGMPYLTSIQQVPCSLRSLDLTDCKQVSDLTPLQYCTALQGLTLIGCYVDFCHLVATLYKVTPLLGSSLRQLTLVAHSVAPTSKPPGLAAFKPPGLEALMHLTQLQDLHLSLDLVPMDRPDWEFLCPIVSSMLNLRVLDLSNNAIGAVMSTLATPLAQLRCLNSLQLGNNDMRREGSTAVCQALVRLPQQLTRLDLTCNVIGTEGAAALASALQAQACTLASLQLPDIRLSDSGITALAPSLCCCTGLTELDLSSNGISHEGAGPLATSLLRLSSLRCLRLSINLLGSEGAATLAPALAAISPSLTSLGISNNGLRDEGVAALASALKSMTAITQLGCSSNWLTVAGAATLAPALQEMTRLERLGLAHNHLGPYGVRALMPALTALPSLQHWDISSNCLGPEGALVLSNAVPQMRQLRGLWLRRDDFSGEPLALIQAAVAMVADLELTLVF